MKEEIKQLEIQLREANAQYRAGTPVMTDSEYDNLLEYLEKLDPTNKLLLDTGSLEALQGDRKTKLPTSMNSFEKVYGNDLSEWVTKYSSEDLVGSVKYDGAALLLEYKNGKLVQAYTKGRGNIGQIALPHAKMIRVPEVITDSIDCYVKVEVVMKKSVFDKLFRGEYKNSRNMIAGLLNRKDKLDNLKYCTYKAHTMISKKKINKINELMYLKENNFNVATFEYVNRCDLDCLTTKLKEIKKEEYLADGIVIEINDYFTRKKLGFHPNGNPKYAVAFKSQFEENIVLTKVNNIEWNISKQGYFIPKVHYESVELNETTCEFATGFNYKFINENNIGIGSIIKLQKSGDIIPYILEMIEPSTKTTVPLVCPHCGYPLIVEDPHLRCINARCIGRNLQQAISFFSILGVEHFGESLIEKVMKFHNITIFEDILHLGPKDFIMDGIGEKSAQKIYDSIQTKLNEAIQTPHILMHATGFFGGTLGSKKIKKIIDKFGINIFGLTVSELMTVDLIAEKSAKQFLEGLPKFVQFQEYCLIDINFEGNVEDVIVGELTGNSYLFSGIRDKELEKYIVENGGTIASSVKENLTTLIVKDVNKQSNKIKKAKQYNVPVIEINEFKLMLKV